MQSLSTDDHEAYHDHLVDNLMTDALALGAQMGKKTIDTEAILAAVSNRNLSQEVKRL